MMSKLVVGVCALILIGGVACAHAPGERHVTAVGDRERATGWLGVAIQDMNPRLARSMKVKTEEGALVNEVIRNSPADSAGIRGEDIIVEFDGRRIDDANGLSRAVRRTAPGTAVKVVVMRKDEKKTLTATIGKSDRRSRARVFGFTPPRIHVFTHHAMYGLTLRNLNKQLAEYFQAPEGKGVLVEEVKKESPADRAGFKAGDVIIKAENTPVAGTEDLWDVLGDRREGDKVGFEVLRKGSKKSLTLTIEEGEDHRRFRSDRRPRSEFFHDFDFDFDLDKEGLDDLHDQIRLEMEKIRPELDRMREDLKRIKIRLRKTDSVES